jgi:hypothetical protein
MKENGYDVGSRTEKLYNMMLDNRRMMDRANSENSLRTATAIATTI